MAIIVLALAFLGGLSMAWAIGATNAPAFGPVNAAQGATVYRGSLLVGLASLVGAVTQGGNVANTIGNDLLAGGPLPAAVAAAVLVVASFLIIASTFSSIPMPSAFLLVGGVTGAGYGVGSALVVPTLSKIAAVWLLIPVVGAAIGYGTARLLRRFVADTAGNRHRIHLAAVALGVYTAYTAGANQAGLPIGPLMNLVDIPLIHLLAFAGLGMLAGALTGSPRLIDAISHDYSRMGPRRAIGALVAASGIAQTATIIGVPISFGQTVIFSVLGAGLVEGKKGMGTRKVAETVGAWVLALTVSFAAAYVIASALV